MKTKEIVMDKQKLTLALECAISEAENPPLGNTKGYYDIFIDTLKEQGYEITNKEKWNNAKEIMKDFKGTQGRWHTVEKNRVIYVENKDQVLVAELDNHKTLGFHQPTPAAVYFNAKLIASAPEMLEALIDLENDNNSIPKPIWDKVQNAIKKALS